MRVSVHRLAVPVAILAVALTLGIFAGMEPNPFLLALAIGALALLCWFVNDFGQVAGAADWRIETVGSTLTHGEDSRVGMLQRQLDGLFRHSTNSLSPTLVAIIDERVRSRYGIDRQTEGDAFRRVVGPELASFVDAADAGSRVVARSLPDILTRIERL